jgi:hypothetical protein
MLARPDFDELCVLLWRKELGYHRCDIVRACRRPYDENMMFQTVSQEFWHMWSRCVFGAAVRSKEKGSIQIQNYEKLLRAR